jgi:predicted dehydrogenase
MVGFNRRFSPLTQILKEHIGEGPMAMIYRINAGSILPDSWIQDKDIGGGRIIGEICHFVDYMTFINGSFPDHVFAAAMSDASNLEDTVNISLKFKNGSVGTISYLANGSKSLFKEYIEIYRAGMTGIIKDFKKLEIYEKRKISKKLFRRDKGQKNMMHNFFKAIHNGEASPIGFENIYSVFLTTFKIIESLRKKTLINIF